MTILMSDLLLYLTVKFSPTHDGRRWLLQVLLSLCL